MTAAVHKDAPPRLRRLAEAGLSPTAEAGLSPWAQALVVVGALGWGACALEPSATPRTEADPGFTDASRADAGATDAFSADAGSDDGFGQMDGPRVPSPALTAFVPEALGIAYTWYDYDELTHVLTPKPELYGARWGTSAAQVRVLSYYNMAGESGFFSLAVQRWEDGWLPAEVLELDVSVKDQWVCVNVQTLLAVSCEAAHHLVLRTDRRVVPAAGFSVAEPSLYWVGDRGDDVEVWRAPLNTAVDPFSLDGYSVPSALRSPSTSVLVDVLPAALTSAADTLNATGCGEGCGDDLGPLVVLQATSDFRVCAWAASMTDEDALVLAARCVPLATSSGTQASLRDAPVFEATLALGGGDGDATLVPGGIAMVQIPSDGPAFVTETRESPEIALWSDDAPFSLFVMRSADGAFTLSGAPGTLVRVRRGALDDTTVLRVPNDLWE